MLAGMRASSAKDGKLRAIHAIWISAIPAEMTLLLKHLYNQVTFCMNQIFENVQDGVTNPVPLGAK